ncbi:hypothetical protein BDA96_08G087000 [Sorghum bicolor]|uniref:Uncharacterized protein n=1 Tax=Sorghum bicolor TaxID=4558 RepID=A0A921U7D8_SORBI|nr:hypothetical protein BDA96_08G087000 [Sorghum bicolor]
MASVYAFRTEVTMQIEGEEGNVTSKTDLTQHKKENKSCMPQLDPEGVVAGTGSLQEAAKTKVTQDNEEEEVAMEKVQGVKVCVGNAGEENELEAHIPQVELKVVAAKADVTQQMDQVAMDIEEHEVTGFLVYSYLKEWDEKRLFVHPGEGSLRTECLVDILQSNQNERANIIPEELRDLLKQLGTYL